MKAMLFFILYANLALSIEKKDILIWEEAPMPPYVFLEGELKGKGIYDPLHSAVREELLKYFKLDERSIPISRRMTFLKDKRDICITRMKKTSEREIIAIYSPVTGIGLDVFLIAVKPYLGDSNGPQSLQKIIRDNKFTIGIEQDRSYGAEIDLILKKDLKTYPTSFFKRPGVGAGDALFKMLASNRIQLLLGHLEEFQWYKSNSTTKANAVEYLYPLSEKKNHFMKSYVACSKSSIGIKAIKIITHLLLSKEFNRREKILAGARNWISPTQLIEYEKFVDQALKSN